MSLRRLANRQTGPAPSAFTLVEALVATAITAIAASALLLGVTSSLQTTSEAQEQAIASGMAQQLLDEVLGARYMEYGLSAYQLDLQPNGAELASGTRELYDDVDDYNGVQTQPPVDSWGVSLGTDDGEGGQRHPHFQSPPGFFDHWRAEIDVYYVNPPDLATRLPSGQVSDYRAVEVRVYYVDPDRGSRQLTKLRRMVAYVPPL